MTKESYLEGKALIEKNYKDSLQQLRRQFALANNPHQIGDMVSDSSTTIKIDKIHVHPGWGDDLPHCMYEGLIYTKKGEPNKREQRGTVFQKAQKS